MVSRAHRITNCLIAFLALGPATGFSEVPPPADKASVVVVANKAVPESVEIARRYMEMREIPMPNLILLQTGEQERISREGYIQTIHNPLLEQLADKQLINAIVGDADEFGRKTVMVFANPIRYIVLCYGIPTTVSSKPLSELDDHALRTHGFKGKMKALGEAFEEGPLAKNMASVDGELALLLQKNVPMTGFIPNPFFRNTFPGKVHNFFKVMRLDGPTPKAVYRLMENTLTGEKYGLRGRAYVDLDGRSGGYQIGNDWMTTVAGVFNNLGFEPLQHASRPTFPVDSRFDAPALYAGWYAQNANGPFTLPGFKFAPGAIAAHLHSGSAAPLHSRDKAWVGPLIEKGACATFGNVAEPYLLYTHYFDLYFASLADGWNVADAAYFALPVLSWQAISIGDPFYRPFSVSLEQQMELIGDPENIHWNQYVILREINLLKKEGQNEAALELAERGMIENPGPALALEQALLLESKKRKKQARKVLGQLSNIVPEDPNDWGLFAEIADTLLRLKDAESAFHIYQNLEKVEMPEKVQLAFLKRGIQSARKAGDKKTARKWDLLVNPPPPVEPEAPDPTN